MTKIEMNVEGQNTSAARAQWQELGFEKISAKDAEATFINIGGDGGFYS